MLLIDVPVLKLQRQDSTSGATGQVFRSRVEVDCGDVSDEVQVGSSDAQDKVTELKQHIIEVIYIRKLQYFPFLLLFQKYKFLHITNTLHLPVHLFYDIT